MPLKIKELQNIIKANIRKYWKFGRNHCRRSKRFRTLLGIANLASNLVGQFITTREVMPRLWNIISNHSIFLEKLGDPVRISSALIEYRRCI